MRKPACSKPGFLTRVKFPKGFTGKKIEDITRIPVEEDP
jgi:hypothetical protein